MRGKRMSNDENAKESVESVNDSDESTSNTAETGDKTTNTAGNVLSKIMEIKESNPKVFFGAIGGLVVVVLVVMMTGGSNKNLPVTKMASLSIGQVYTLKGVNTYDPAATIRLVAVPGSMAAYDDTEKGDREGGCKHMPQGTKVKLVQIQEAFGKAKFVEVEMINGECAGKKGWAVATNLN
jgi:hypothetical protein